ncbi:GH25 family lysozyme [Flavobacteriales bacterium]|nr:GH25 family lysozyme [Flavobacteriales bacterium]
MKNKKHIVFKLIVFKLLIVSSIIFLSHPISLELYRKVKNKLSHNLHAKTPAIKGFSGIDISHYQKNIKWDDIDNKKVSFVFIKATEAKTYKDCNFNRNWKGAAKQQLKKGAYHFFHPGKDPIQQFDNFKNTVQLKKGDLAPLLDVEVTNGLNKKEIIKQVNIWLVAAENHYEIKPLIYTTQRFYNTYFKNSFQDYEFVIARFNKKKPNLLDGRKVVFWQYTDQGKVDGIKPLVDRQVYLGELNKFNNYCLK